MIRKILIKTVFSGIDSFFKVHTLQSTYIYKNEFDNLLLLRDDSSFIQVEFLLWSKLFFAISISLILE